MDLKNILPFLIVLVMLPIMGAFLSVVIGNPFLFLHKWVEANKEKWVEQYPKFIVFYVIYFIYGIFWMIPIYILVMQ